MLKSILCNTLTKSTRFLTSITPIASSNHQTNSFSNHVSNYGWQIDKYHIDEEFKQDQLIFNSQMKQPIIYNPNDLLIEVKAASVNPLDLVMIKGYGREILDNINVITQITKCKLSYDRFPLVLGRDFSGIIRNVGANVTKFKVGDEIWGSLSPFKQGSHCKYIVASQDELSLKPTNLTFEEAASIPYAALTSWSALFKFGNLRIQDAKNKKVLILGATGGLGTFTVQLLKSFGCHVSVTCSKDANEFVNQLAKLDAVYDYRNLDKLFMEKEGYFDYILDYASTSTVDDDSKLFRLLRNNSNSYYLTTRSPLMKNADKNGFFIGLLKSLQSASEMTINSLQMRTNARWAFYETNQSALEYIRKLCETNQIRPVVQQYFDLEQLPLAYQTVYNSHLRGKIVIKF